MLWFATDDDLVERIRVPGGAIRIGVPLVLAALVAAIGRLANRAARRATTGAHSR